MYCSTLSLLCFINLDHIVSVICISNDIIFFEASYSELFLAEHKQVCQMALKCCQLDAIDMKIIVFNFLAFPMHRVYNTETSVVGRFCRLIV